jgi:Tfp pilus assembly protein PilF
MTILLAALAVGGCASSDNALVDGDAASLDAPIPTKLAEPAELAIAKGESLLAARDFDAADAKFGKALKQEPDNFQARLGLAEAKLGLHRLMEALEGFESVMESDSYRARALQGRGITLALLGREELSLPLLRQAVEEDPSLWRAWNAIGRSHALRGDVQQALASYDRALLSNAQAAPVHNNRGMALIAAMRYVDAEAAFRRAIAIAPELEVARMNLRLALAWQGRYEEAIAELARGDAPRVLNNIGFVAMEKGDFGKAKLFFTKAMEISPSYYPTAAANLEYLEERKKMAVSSAALG